MNTKITKYRAIILLFIIASIFVSKQQLNAQEYNKDIYTPFDLNNSIWSVSQFKYSPNGDTIINDKLYTKIYRQYSDVPFDFDITKAEYFCAIRNDTLNKRIYGVFKEPREIVTQDGSISLGYSSDNTEFLLYDFVFDDNNVEIASFDVIDMDNKIYLNNFIKVGSKTVTLLDGSQRNAIEVQKDDSNSLTTLWIEGIGSNAGLFSQYFYYLIDFPSYLLLCYQQDNVLLYKDTNYGETCFHKPIGDNIKDFDIKSKSNNFTVYPNPTNGIINIQSQENLNNYTVDIYNVLGIKVFNKNLKYQQNNIDLSSLPEGMYFIIFSSGKITESKKILIKH